ncbi:MAG TPA: phosphoadenylyl-sulfate reductase, partial [Bacteroidia bacterium]|nr:phosphoadenylyl-sulfate reductase [Bacteroidia bacterium]
MEKSITDSILKSIAGRNTEEALSLLSKNFPNKIVFSTSFGLEDQAITHIIFSKNIPIKIFTLDTGRLFPETYSVWSRTKEIYNKNISSYSPYTETIQNLVSEKGPNSFYESVENRQKCCYIRKVEPLKRALKGNEIWVTGIRKEQSASRNNLSPVEWDENNHIIKYHPLFDWGFEEVKSFISKNHVPYNPLHDKGFPSIGCQPCTRAVKPGDDPRSGRWWWEDATKKECGLHTAT